MTNTISVAIIEDELDARALIKLHLERHEYLRCVGEAGDGIAALALLEAQTPDLIFLDIQLPGHNGMEILERATTIPQVIFITAYDDFAVKAFEWNAVDYLLKPFTPERFDQAVNRAIQRLATPVTREIVHQLIDQFQQRQSHNHLRRLPYKQGNVTEYIDTERVRYVRAADQYEEVHTETKKYLVRQSMDSLEKQLSPMAFIRIHRSAIVRLSLVKAIQQDDFRHYQVILYSGEVLPLSQVRKPLLIAKLG